MIEREEILDGFGHSVDEQVAMGGGHAVLYGGAPPGMGGGGIPGWGSGSGSPTSPPKPARYQLTVSGPNGTELTVTMTEEQWAELRPVVLEKLK